MQKTNQRESVKVLSEAIELQIKKSQDYQNPLSSVTQVDYYPRGVWSILDIINAKYLRMVSVLETMENGGKVNFESVEDSAVDLINYASFVVAYMRGEVDGQQADKDIFNRKVNDETSNQIMPKKFQSNSKQNESTFIIDAWVSSQDPFNLANMLQHNPAKNIAYSQKYDIRTYVNGKQVKDKSSIRSNES